MRLSINYFDRDFVSKTKLQESPCLSARKKLCYMQLIKWFLDYAARLLIKGKRTGTHRDAILSRSKRPTQLNYKRAFAAEIFFTA